VGRIARHAIPLLPLQDDASRLVEALPMALSAQAYARSELLWYFRHVAEKLPTPAPAASKLAYVLLEKPVQLQLAQDGHVVVLIAAMTSLYDLLVSY
jgi:hypothetical protein